ncbi:MAG TPA: amidohydrolase family protein [Euzebyales bacterium]|nr:amidohydrolase family protein [Euzebyales bacterium]
MIDHHAHPFDRKPGPFEPTRLAIDLDDLDGGRPTAPVRPDTVWRALFVSRLARRFGVPVGELAAARAEHAVDYQAHVRRLFSDAGIDVLVLDPGWPPGSERHADDFARLSGCTVHLLWRLEPLVDDLLEQGRGVGEILAAVDEHVGSAHGRGFCGFKSVIAYRSGLAIDPDATTARAGSALRRGGPSASKPLRDLMFQRLLAGAADTGLPLQVHTGFGDSDLRLGSADPTLLEDVLDTPAGRHAPIVLLHSGFPYQDVASYLAAARSNVHVDVSLVNIFAPANLPDGLRRVVGVAPVDRVLFGTDAYLLPEAFWFAAVMLREAWQVVRDGLLAQGMDAGWTTAAEHAMFDGNARRLYRLDGDGTRPPASPDTSEEDRG